MMHKHKSSQLEHQHPEMEQARSEKIKKKSIAAGSIVSSPMFRRFLVPILMTMLCFTAGVYLFAVPYLKDLVYSLEEKSVQINLKISISLSNLTLWQQRLIKSPLCRPISGS